jgi:hypothetical protein
VDGRVGRGGRPEWHPASLTDYDAMYVVLEPAVGSPAGRTIVNLGSAPPDKARAAAAWAAGHGAGHLTGVCRSLRP